jgi:hypothetical protein
MSRKKWRPKLCNAQITRNERSGLRACTVNTTFRPALLHRFQVIFADMIVFSRP